MTNLAKLEPVRIYAVVATALALVVHYVPSIPSELVLGLVAALLGIGLKPVRSAVTPNSRVPVINATPAQPGEDIRYV